MRLSPTPIATSWSIGILKPANILVTTGRAGEVARFRCRETHRRRRSDLTRTAGGAADPGVRRAGAVAGRACNDRDGCLHLGFVVVRAFDRHPALVAGWCADRPRHARRTGETGARAEHNGRGELPDPPFPPRMLRGDLDAIVAKALRKEPAHRYETVDALKLDVERALSGEAVSRTQRCADVSVWAISPALSLGSARGQRRIVISCSGSGCGGMASQNERKRSATSRAA